MIYYVDYTYEDESEIIAKVPDLEMALAIGQAKQKEYKEAGKCGIISAYTITGERGFFPMRKYFELWKL